MNCFGAWRDGRISRVLPRAQHSQTEFGRRLRMYQPATGRLEEGEPNPCIDVLNRVQGKLGSDFDKRITLGSI